MATLPSLLPSLASRMVTSDTPLPPRASIVLVDAATAPVSATVVRRAIAERRPLTGLVPASVSAYIERQGLYAAQAATDN